MSTINPIARFTLESPVNDEFEWDGISVLDQFLLDAGFFWWLCRENCEWLSLREWQVASLRFEEGCEMDQIGERLGLCESQVAETFRGLILFLNEMASETFEVTESA